MKKTISLLLSLCMLATMMFAFNVPAEAVDIYEITEAHEEFFFPVGEQTFQYTAFSVSSSGGYIIQTLGYSDGDAENPTPDGRMTGMVLMDANYEIVAEDTVNYGYAANSYIYCQLVEGEPCVLTMTFAEGTQYCRLLITHTEEKFIEDGYGRGHFERIHPYYVEHMQISNDLEFTFTAENIDEAQVALLYNGEEEGPAYWEHFTIEIDCMYEVTVLLLDPLTLSPDTQCEVIDGTPIELSAIPSLLVVYFKNVDADEILDYRIDVTISFS